MAFPLTLTTGVNPTLNTSLEILLHTYLLTYLRHSSWKRDGLIIMKYNKCELIIEPGTVVCDLVLQSFKRVPVSEAVLLDTPLTEGPALGLGLDWSERCSGQTRAMETEAYCFTGCPHTFDGFLQCSSCAPLVTLFILGRSRSSRQF